MYLLQIVFATQKLVARFFLHFLLCSETRELARTRNKQHQHDNSFIFLLFVFSFLFPLLSVVFFFLCDFVVCMCMFFFLPFFNYYASISGMPHTVHPYDTIEALIQQQERSSHLSHSQPHNQPHTQPHTPSHVQSVVPVNVRLPSTPDSPTKERPRIKGRMTPYAFFVQQR